MNREKIVVVGSSNTDMTVKSKSLPKPGETVLGGDFYMQQGGKGANQAVAVARLGGRAVFVGKVGEDAFGEASVAAYRADGIDTRHVTATRRAPSGVALIMVDQGAENCISVAPGANACLAPEDILAARAEFEQAAIVLLQMEIPMPAIVQAVELGHASGARVILNPAPAQFVPDSVLSRLYMITPNRAEAEKLTGIKVTDMESAGRAARMLADKGIGRVVITLGGKGVFIRDAEEEYCIPAERVEAVDTTAAGDTFNGALCVALSEGRTLFDAVRFASRAAAIAVTRMGAQTSIPYRTELKVESV
ncbi:ribokinase [uncultured Alistipes sp.]|uniref:ribokinase n=1 Tax=uncultured Alistipes sp. TaxID=538949 RepID=UPI0026360CB7|nr:ribokinase [uncultured Alistipes sp.]